MRLRHLARGWHEVPTLGPRPPPISNPKGVASSSGPFMVYGSPVEVLVRTMGMVSSLLNSTILMTYFPFSNSSFVSK